VGTPEVVQEMARQALLLDAKGDRAAATFICEQKPRGWRIVHVHSSQLLPWDR